MTVRRQSRYGLILPTADVVVQRGGAVEMSMIDSMGKEQEADAGM